MRTHEAARLSLDKCPFARSLCGCGCDGHRRARSAVYTKDLSRSAGAPPAEFRTAPTTLRGSTCATAGLAAQVLWGRREERNTCLAHRTRNVIHLIYDVRRMLPPQPEASPPNRVIDSHVHFWDPAKHDHDWLDEAPDLNRRFLPGDLAEVTHLPSGVVFVEADRRSDQALDEVEWAISLARSGPPIVGIVAHAPLEYGNRVAALVRILSERALVVGVRRLLQEEPLSFISDPGLLEGHRILGEHGLTSDICIRAEQMPAVTKLVRACPDTDFVLDHLGNPAVASHDLDPWLSDLRKLAACPNISCKLSGLATRSPVWRRDETILYLRCALEVFGPDRCLFGSDWPVSQLAVSYEDWLLAVLGALDHLTATERAGVLGGNAVRVYQLKTHDTRWGDTTCL